jgi:hypothetical protein
MAAARRNEQDSDRYGRAKQGGGNAHPNAATQHPDPSPSLPARRLA